MCSSIFSRYACEVSFEAIEDGNRPSSLTAEFSACSTVAFQDAFNVLFPEIIWSTSAA